MGYFVTPIKQCSSTAGGAVFITEITAQLGGDNVGGKIFSEGGFTLNSCVSSTELITVSILALTGFSSFQPLVTVLGQRVSLIQDEDQNVWLGTIDIDLKGASTVLVNHIDGATDQCEVITETIPVISAARFVGEYPSGQTELKENDRFDFTVSSPSPFVAIELDDNGASKEGTENFASTLSKTISVLIANRGNTTQALGIRVRISNENGTKSDWLDTASLGSTDKWQLVFLNNAKPSIELLQVEYPENQQAVKGNETASVQHTVSNFDRISYESPMGELAINDANTFSSPKLTQRIAGNYNVNIANFKVTAYKDSNGSSSSKELTVNIANLAAELSFITPKDRLISGGNQGTLAQIHPFELQSNQELIGVPLISIPEGTLLESFEQQAGTTGYTQQVSIHDNDTKGVHQVQLISAINLAGIPTVNFKEMANYELGGFAKRTLNFTEFTNEVAIGTSVVSIEKLTAFDKDQIQMQLSLNLENNIQGFSITEPSQVYNPTGNILHWNDTQAINNNTTGFASISLEEPP